MSIIAHVEDSGTPLVVVTVAVTPKSPPASPVPAEPRTSTTAQSFLAFCTKSDTLTPAMSKSIGPAKWLFVPFQVPLMPSVNVPNVEPAFLLRPKVKSDFNGFEKVKSLNDIDLYKLKAKVIGGPPVLAK